MPSSIRFVIIPAVLLIALIETEAPGNRSANCPKEAAKTGQIALRLPKTLRYEDSRVSMGCVYTIVVYGHDLARLREAVAAALDEIDRIDRLMSHYKND